jgi:hypothetical protein
LVEQREYEEFKVRINALVAKAMKVPAEGWIMKGGTPWPGNNTRDHPGMIQVFLGHSGGHDTRGQRAVTPVGIDHRLFCRSTIGSFADQPSETNTCEKITKQ